MTTKKWKVTINYHYKNKYIYIIYNIVKCPEGKEILPIMPKESSNK